MIPLLLWACHKPPAELPEQCASAERYAVLTDDGATIVLHRHPGQGPPVLLVHGISANARSWDLTPDRSLAEYLAENGFDPWLLDMRGHGEALVDAEGHRQWGGWSMEDYARRDLPAAIAFIREKTGAARVGYVGHSLGGMVGAIYAGTVEGGDESLFALVALGSPLDFTDPDPLMDSALSMARIPMPVVPTELGAEMQAWLGPRDTPLDRTVDLLLINDIDPAVRPLLYRSVPAPMTSGELKQLALALPAQSFVDPDGFFDYRATLADVHTPTLVIAGRADQIAPVDRVMSYYNGVGSAEKRLIIAGRASGFAADYGHLDLVMGDHARAELYPEIAAWLQR